MARKCGHKVGEVKEKRRALRRRDFSIDPGTKETIYEIHALAPKYNFVKNSTSILTPETSNGPYFYPQSQTLRQDIREGQPGLPLSLEIGVIDIDTCEPLEDVLVDIWVSKSRSNQKPFGRLKSWTNLWIHLSIATLPVPIAPSPAFRPTRPSWTYTQTKLMERLSISTMDFPILAYVPISRIDSV